MDSSAPGPGENLPRTLIWEDRLLIALLAITVVGVVLQITLGGVVRVTGSGDGCPDWPQCFGRWYPPFEYHALLEYSHRTAGALLGLAIVAATVRVWVKHRDRVAVAWLTTSSLALVFIVGMLGGAVVLNDLDPAIRTVHLMLAEAVALLAILALVASTFARPGMPEGGPGGARGGVQLHARDKDSPWIWGRVSDEHRAALNLAAVAAVLTLVALLSGSYAVWREAGAVCASWPLCGGRVVPESTLAWIHVAHRVLSLVSIVAVLIAGHRAWRLNDTSRALRIAALGAAVLIVAQMLMGAANPWTVFAEWARAGHLAMATLVWVDMVFIVALILRPVPARDLAAAGYGNPGLTGLTTAGADPTGSSPTGPSPAGGNSQPE
ncbi:MAG: COX15/CtaA family protein [Dehalococcoidia bacterium]|jgi:heme A synthase|nr:COX15/CtaA family protein [Dehalococcoidia bacterium]